MEPIQNVFDGPQEDKALKKLENNKYFEEQLPIEQLSSSDLKKCEQAVRKCQSFTEVTNLAIALSVRHIVINQLYLDEYETHTEYFAASEDRLGMSKQDVSKYLNSGIAYYDNRHRLDDAGFKPEGDFSKLIMLPKAIEKLGESEAVKALCNMSKREFTDIVRGPVPKQLNYTKNLEVSLNDKGIVVEGKAIIKLADVKKIVDQGSEPYLVGLESAGEKAAITRFLKEFRSKK